MTPIKITAIPVYPSTNVRSTQNEKWLFRVTEEYLEDLDNKRIETHGKAGHLAARKRQLEKYNAYKEELRNWARKKEFAMPIGYFAVHFHVPFPQSWRKPKRLKMAGQPHMNTPDADNYIKALFDGIMPRRNRIAGQKGSDDRKIHCYTMFKIWVPEGDEKIIIVEYNPSEYTDVFNITT